MTEEKNKQTERLQVVLARFGLASRRGVVDMIEAGEVTVNGEIVREKGFRVDPEKDDIRVKDEVLSKNQPQKHYFVFNKPKGVMTTLQDPHAESTVADFFKDIPVRLFPVGRLDRDTTGLLILTNDGELSFRLTHPKFGVNKRYHVVVRGVVTEATVKRLERGIILDEDTTAPCKIEIESKTSKETTLFITMHEGKKRQIRRIFEKVGHRVLHLMRLEYGPLSLGKLKLGEKRELTKNEVKSLWQATQ